MTQTQQGPVSINPQALASTLELKQGQPMLLNFNRERRSRQLLIKDVDQLIDVWATMWSQGPIKAWERLGVRLEPVYTQSNQGIRLWHALVKPSKNAGTTSLVLFPEDWASGGKEGYAQEHRELAREIASFLEALDYRGLSRLTDALEKLKAASNPHATPHALCNQRDCRKAGSVGVQWARSSYKQCAGASAQQHDKGLPNFSVIFTGEVYWFLNFTDGLVHSEIEDPEAGKQRNLDLLD